MGNILLGDIGNTHMHLYDRDSVFHLSPQRAIKEYGKTKLSYISVNSSLEERIKAETIWINISDKMHIPGEYETMGVDRRALCLSHDNGLFIDAGSAITVDMVERGSYKGGYIFPGLSAMLKSYRQISDALDVTLERSLDLTRLPLTTKEQISYGIIASIKALIEKHREHKPLYFTGGDGAFLAGFFRDATYDETLVFKGMQYAL